MIRRRYVEDKRRIKLSSASLLPMTALSAPSVLFPALHLLILCCPSLFIFFCLIYQLASVQFLERKAACTDNIAIKFSTELQKQQTMSKSSWMAADYCAGTHRYAKIILGVLLYV